jgi:putative transposase
MTQRFKRLSHSIYEYKHHVVCCPKYRYRIFKGEIGECVRQQVYRICGQKEQIEVLELNVQPDHVHPVASIPPKYGVSAVMGYLKGKMALRLFQQYESLGRRYWGRHLWREATV